MAQATSRIRNSLFNITTGVGSQVLIMIISFGVRTIFIYCLGKTYLGVNGLFSNVLSILSFAELGIGQAIVYALYKPIADGDEERMLSLMKLFGKVYRILFFVILGLGLSLMPFLPYFIHDFDTIPDLNIIYLMYLASSASSYLFAYKSTFLTACQKNYMVSYVGIIVYLISSSMQVISLLIFNSFILYLSINLASTLLQNIYVAHKVDRIFPFLKRKDAKILSKEDLRKIKKNVYSLILYKIGALSLSSTDNLLISMFVGLITVGLFSNYTIILGTVSSILGIAFVNLSASIGHLNATESDDRKYFMFKVINLAVFWLYSYSTICIYVLISPFIVNCWLGESFGLGDNIVFIMCLNFYIHAMLFAPVQYRQTLGLFVQGKYRPIISAIINIVVSVILGKYYGLAGILWGTAITRLTTNSWFDPMMVYRKIGVPVWRYYIDYLLKLGLLLTVGATCAFVFHIFVITNILQWLLSALLMTVFINGLYILLFHNTAEYQYLKSVSTVAFHKVVNKLPRSKRRA